MPTSDEIMRQQQAAIRRELDRRKVSLKAVAFDSGIPYPTLLTYFPEKGGRKPVMLPASAIYAMVDGEAMPLDLLSMLVPDGFMIARVPAGINHDEVEGACREFLALKGRAHRADSPSGPDIAPCEEEGLNEQVVRLRLAVGQ